MFQCKKGFLLITLICRWYEKTKLLSSRNAHDKFSGFEVSTLQQLNNIYANKQQLIRRTQLTGATRGTTYHILGQNDDMTVEVRSEFFTLILFINQLLALFRGYLSTNYLVRYCINYFMNRFIQYTERWV